MHDSIRRAARRARGPGNILYVLRMRMRVIRVVLLHCFVCIYARVAFCAGADRERRPRRDAYRCRPETVTPGPQLLLDSDAQCPLAV